MTRIWRGRVTADGRLEIDENVAAWLVHLGKLRGKDVDITITRHRFARSLQQNRYYWGVVVPLLADHCGYERQDMHEVLAMKFLRLENCPITGVPRRKHTPACDTAEFAAYVDSCIRLAAELGVVIPSPEDVQVLA